MFTTKPLKVLFAVRQGPLSPGSRYRVFQYLPRLEAMGIEPAIAIAQGDRSTIRSLNHSNAWHGSRLVHHALLWLEIQRFVVRLLRLCPHFDRIYLYRIPVPAWAGPMLSRHRDRLLFDFDDALDQAELDGTWLQRLRVRTLRGGFVNAVRAARLTVTSNERNACVVRSYGGQVEIVPTSVDVAHAVVRDRTVPGSPPVVGWIGTPSTARYLSDIEEPLRRVAATHRVAVRLVGAGRNPFRTVPAEVRAWALQTEKQEIGEFDIGLMPMPDTPWTRGKAALKAIEYSASGAPTIASWTETNQAILGEGEGTLFCRTPEDWVSALGRLLENHVERGTLGQRARLHVSRHYSLDVQAPRLFRVIAGEGPAAGSGLAPGEQQP